MEDFDDEIEKTEPEYEDPDDIPVVQDDIFEERDDLVFDPVRGENNQQRKTHRNVMSEVLNKYKVTDEELDDVFNL